MGLMYHCQIRFMLLLIIFRDISANHKICLRITHLHYTNATVPSVRAVTAFYLCNCHVNEK